MENPNGGGRGTGTGTVVLFPFMAQGHLNPFLDLARLLSSRLPFTITITIVSTPANVLKLRQRFASYPNVHFSQLNFPADSVQNTDSLNSLPSISNFYRCAQYLLQTPFRELIAELTRSNGGKPPVCIISDMFLGFTVDVAHSFGSHQVPLYTSGPYAMSIYNSIFTHFPHFNVPGEDDDDIIPLPDLPDVIIRRNQLSVTMKKADPVNDPTARNPGRQAEYCRRADGSLWNTVQVLEKKSLEAWAKSSGKPVWAVGPLLHERGGKDPEIMPEKCADWLNQKSPNSVVYVSFGSQNSVPCQQMMELAKGLEQSGKAFVWVLRNPTGVEVSEEFNQEWLPQGFEERTRESGMGMLVPNWAPQMQILSHPSVGAFLSHCGWNSVLESLSQGVPIIGWPLGSEQHYNAKLLDEELGVCVEVARGYDAKVDSGAVAGKIKMVLDGEDGKDMRRRSQILGAEMKKAYEADSEVKGSSARALDEFVSTLLRWDEEWKPSVVTHQAE